jgi:Domain of unknown function (DUF4337)
MSETTELLENMEHAGHGGHEEHGGAGGHGSVPLARSVGITMAVLGVLLAICSALVGATRTELVTTMVEKTNVMMRYQAASTKFRMLQANLQQMDALLPSDPKRFQALGRELDDTSGKLTGDNALLAAMLRAFHDRLMLTVVPTTSDLKRLVEVARGYKAETAAAYAWKESYNEEIEAYEHAGEHYEWAMLASEIGIVIASIALLLSSRIAWIVSIVLGLTCVVLVAITNLQARSALHVAHHEIAHARAAYNEVANEERAAAADEALFESIDRMK